MGAGITSQLGRTLISASSWHIRMRRFGDVMAWLAQNRDGLTVFSHPNTGDSDAAQLRDHRDHAVWMGAVRPLKLSRFGGCDQGQT
jgi:aromatic ring-cleaving dioxygenase